MSSTLTKEFRALILPACVAATGSIIPPTDDIGAMLGSLACFGGFAMLAAMSFGLEFQHRTLGLLLSQPTERKRLWQDKLMVVFLTGVAVALVNWQFQQLLSGLPGLLLLLVWMFLLACVCSSGFWIQSTGSTLGGLGCSAANQLLVFGGIGFAIERHCKFTIGLVNTDTFLAIFLPSIFYCLAFLWLGRRFWKRAFLKIGAGVLLFLLLCGVSQLLASTAPSRQCNPAETCLSGLFLLAVACSAGFWTILTRTTIGGAVFSVAAQFLFGVAFLLGLSRIYAVDLNIEQSRFLGPLGLFSIIYCAAFLWLGWHKFSRLELRDSSAGDSLEQNVGFFYRGRRSPNWLRCQADQHLLNLIRKELRLQTPLLSLAGIFVICWLAAYCLQWLQPEKKYAYLKDMVSCLYAPVALLLAGCISLGDEKVLGLRAWHLALPVSARTQWFVKLVVAATTGATLGLALPLCLYLISAMTRGTGFLGESNANPWIAIATISGGLFILSFWTATLLASTVRAALSAVAALIAFSACVAVGGWCAEHLGFLGVIAPFSETARVLNSVEATLLLGLALALATALFQSFRQFRRVQIPTAVLVKAPLALAGVFLLLGFLLRAAA